MYMWAMQPSQVPKKVKWEENQYGVWERWEACIIVMWHIYIVGVWDTYRM